MVVHLSDIIEINEIKMKFVLNTFQNILKIIENILKILKIYFKAIPGLSKTLIAI